MSSLLLAISLITFAPGTAPGVSADGSQNVAASELPPRVAELTDGLGREKMLRLTEACDSFVDDLARTIAVLDKRKAAFRPARLPKTTLTRLVAFRATYDALMAGAPTRDTDLLALARWRLQTRLAALDAELVKAKRGLEGIKSTLARLKAMSVDPGAHYPVRIAYLQVGTDGSLENVREEIADVAALEPAMRRIDSALTGLVTHMQAAVDELNAKRRAAEAVDGSFGEMLASLG